MKIGILTYHCAHNYGAVLQCYALQSYLRSLGHEVFVVDYKPSYFHYGLFVWYKWLSANPVKLINKLLFQTKTFFVQLKRFAAFEEFIKKYIAPQSMDFASNESDIDCFIFGSDQIWRQNGESFDPIFWGDFNAAKGAKLVSYAASMGKNSLTIRQQNQIQKWLERFDSIAVRESSLKDLLSPLIKKDIQIVVDPTLLLCSNDWDRIAKCPNYSKPYILIYQVIENPVTLRLANEAAKELNAEIIELAAKIDDRKSNHKMVYDASPNEFIGWIAHASFVVTTSFHGTAFSLIYQRPFISIKQHRLSDLRIQSILETFALPERFVDCENGNWKKSYVERPKIDFSAVKYSIQYLESL